MGEYDIVMTTVNFFLPVISFQISTSTYKYLKMIDTKKESKISYISNGFFILILGNLFFAALAILVNVFFRKIDYVYLILLMVFTTSIYLFLRDVIRGLGVSKSYAVSGIINTSVLFTINLLFFTLLNVVSLKFLFFCVVLANLCAICYMVFDNRLFYEIRLNLIDLILLKKMLFFSMPLIPNVVSWWLINLADKYIILNNLGLDSNGTYAVSSRFPTILTLINSIFIFAWQDHTIVKEKKSNENFSFNSKMFDNFVKFEFSLIFLFISLSEFIIRYLVNEEFLNAYYYMPLLFIGAGFSSFSGYLGAFYLKSEKTVLLLITSIVAGSVNLIICLLLVNSIGLFASVIGTFVSFFIMFFLRVFFLDTKFNFKANYFTLISLTLIAITLSYYVYQPFKYSNYLMIIFSVSYFISINTKNIIKILKLIKE